MARELVDDEFGAIRIKRIASSRHVRVRVTATGQISATMPRLAPLFVLKQLLESSREDLRQAIADNTRHAPPIYRDGDMIGSSHRIVVESAPTASTRIVQQSIIWRLPPGSDPLKSRHQDIVRRAVRRALDSEAKAYLPRRLAYLAETYGFHWRSIRYSNAKGRWGSCSSQGVISLNVALMRLPKPLIDYVLIHELSHTRHLNHSPAFWGEVGRCYPDYKAARKELKNHTPYL